MFDSDWCEMVDIEGMNVVFASDQIRIKEWEIE